MARYWVGNSGLWSDTAHWSTTSGGAGGASVPSSTDDVIIDSASFSASGHIITTDDGSSSSYDIFFKSFLVTSNDSFTIRPGNYGDYGTSVSIYAYGNITLSDKLTLGYSTKGGGYFDLFIIGDSVFSQNGANLEPSGQLSIIYIDYGKTLTLSSDISVNRIILRNGSFVSNGYNISTAGISMSGTSAKVFNIANSTITLINGVSSSNNVSVSGSGYTIINDNSVMVLGVANDRGYTSVVQLATVTEIPSGKTVPLVGNNSFTSLKVKGTLKVTSGTTQTVGKLVVDGGSIEATSTSAGTINISGSNQIVAGEANHISKNTITGAGTYYAGSGATNSGGNTGWLFSNAPLVKTLTDNFNGTTIDTSKWTVTSGTLAQSGGQLVFENLGGTASAQMVSVNQYLAEASSIQFKANVLVGELIMYLANAQLQYGVSARRNIPDIYVILTPTSGQFFIRAATNYTSVAFSNTYAYYRIRESNGTIYLDGSNDGVGYTNVKSAVASNYGLDTTQLIARPVMSFYTDVKGAIFIDDFNIDLEPTAQFTSNVTSGNTPLVVNFTDQSNFSPTSWSWNFGDSTTSTSQNPVKTYSTPGTYTVSLQSSNSNYTRTVTKTNYITASPNVYSRSISGTLRFGGSVSRKLLAKRALSGTLLFGGSVRAVVLRDVEGLQDKRYLYKVYDPDGQYIEVWKDVISELNFTHEINTIGSTTSVELARNSDSVGVTISNLLTEDGQPILTEDDFNIQVATESRNQIGSGSSVDYNNRVDIVVFYGGVEPLLTEDGDPILTEDDEEILADIGAPNGRRIFTGFISEINSRYGNSETTVVQLTSYGWDLDQFPITTSTGNTTVPFNSYDPSNIATEAIEKFRTDSASYGTYTTVTNTSVAETGTVVSYTFRANTYKEVVDKTLELMPSNWYYRIGLGDNIVYYNERATQPHHLFYLGKHIKALDLKGSILDSTNRVLFTGGGDPALFINTEEVPYDRTRRTLDILSDSRVTLTDSAQIISQGRIDSNNKPLFRTTVEILSVQYDIESINVGEVVGFRNFGNYVDALTMQIVGLTYSPDSVQLQLETKPPTISRRVEDIRRALAVTENANVPDAPV